MTLVPLLTPDRNGEKVVIGRGVGQGTKSSGPQPVARKGVVDLSPQAIEDNSTQAKKPAPYW